MNIETNAAAPFAALGIDGQLLNAAVAAGFTEPKPIQAKAIPPHLAGRDIIAIAQTGSGKTAAFVLPLLAKIIAARRKPAPRTVQALILAPTRELAVQIEEVVKLLSKGMRISTALVLGGVSRHSQVKRLQNGIDILIATPGRLVDLVRERDVNLSQTRWVVLDEADRMLDMGFLPDVRRLMKATSAERQTALYSATMPDEIAELTQTFLKDPVRVEAAPQSTTVAAIDQSVIIARTKQKRAVLARLLNEEATGSVIIFARTKHGADRVARDLEHDGFEAGVIHGNKSQNARQRALGDFRNGSTRILVATDIAARGIDVPGIGHVINFDLPDEAESYVHRIGRTGRNGADGISITLCDPSEASKLRSVEKIIRKKLPVTADHSGAPVTVEEERAAAARAEQQQKHGNRGARPGRGQPKAAHRKGGGGKAAESKAAEPRAARPAKPAPSRRPEAANGDEHRSVRSANPAATPQGKPRRPRNRRRFGQKAPAKAA